MGVQNLGSIFYHLHFIGKLVNKQNPSVHLLHPISHFDITKHTLNAELAGAGVDADEPILSAIFSHFYQER